MKEKVSIVMKTTTIAMKLTEKTRRTRPQRQGKTFKNNIYSNIHCFPYIEDIETAIKAVIAMMSQSLKQKRVLNLSV